MAHPLEMANVTGFGRWTELIVRHLSQPGFAASVGMSPLSKRVRDPLPQDEAFAIAAASVAARMPGDGPLRCLLRAIATVERRSTWPSRK